MPVITSAANSSHMLLSIYIPLLLPIIAPHANWTAVTHSHHATTAILAPKMEMSSEIAQFLQQVTKRVPLIETYWSGSLILALKGRN